MLARMEPRRRTVMLVGVVVILTCLTEMVPGQQRGEPLFSLGRRNRNRPTTTTATSTTTPLPQPTHPRRPVIFPDRSQPQDPLRPHSRPRLRGPVITLPRRRNPFNPSNHYRPVIRPRPRPVITPRPYQPPTRPYRPPTRPPTPRRNFRVASVQVEPFIFRNRSGYIPDLLNELSQIGNFDFHLTTYSQAILGIWNLLIEKVANGEFDMAAGPITVTRFRENFVDFSRAISRHVPHILVKSEDRDEVAFANSLINSPVSIGTLEDSAVLDYFLNSEDPRLQQLYHQLRANPSRLAHTMDDGLHKVYSENYAFFVDGPIAEYLREQDPCALSAVPYGTNFTTYAFAVNKALPASALTMLNDAIYQVTNNGFLRNLKNKYFNEKIVCEDYYEDII